MKAIQLLPLAYFADIHGFIYFVPYMLFVMAIAQALTVSRRRSRRVRRNTVRVPSSIVSVDTGDVVLAVVRS